MEFYYLYMIRLGFYSKHKRVEIIDLKKLLYIYYQVVRVKVHKNG